MKPKFDQIKIHKKVKIFLTENSASYAELGYIISGEVLSAHELNKKENPGFFDLYNFQLHLSHHNKVKVIMLKTEVGEEYLLSYEDIKELRYV
ncbi:MAG: hypothetical protein ACJ75J_17535 [Cytophagaceae bacterium]